MPFRTVTPTPRRPSMGRTPTLPTVAAAPALRGATPEQDIYVLLAKLLQGKLNNTIEVTLEVAPATETEVADPRITAESVVLASPVTATAAAEVPTLYFEAETGLVTLQHSASAASDRTFRLAIFA